jgi:hypothetical protein
MARDILSIYIFTVSLESTFSIGGHVIDQYRSSLKPDIVEALVCTRDWLYREHDTINYLHILISSFTCIFFYLTLMTFLLSFDIE